VFDTEKYGHKIFPEFEFFGFFYELSLRSTNGILLHKKQGIVLE